MNADIELADLVYDEQRGGYWLKPVSERSTKGRCQSPAEVAFWNAVADRLPGVVRQFHIAGTRYHFDFAIIDKMIGIEVDGYGWHSTRKQRQHDSARDRILQAKGWKVLRFTASEIMQDAEKCVAEIADLLSA